MTLTEFLSLQPRELYRAFELEPGSEWIKIFWNTTRESNRYLEYCKLQICYWNNLHFNQKNKQIWGNLS